MRDAFRRASLATPDLDARLLAELAFGMDRLDLVRREREPAGSDALARLQDFAQRRLQGEPVARIVGEKEFWGLPFGLNQGTLVPRPETELLVQHGLAVLAGRGEQRVLDLGTGSGCIPIAILVECPEATAIATELSSEAIQAAQRNAARLAVSQRLDVRQGSWFEPIAAAERFDLITANPPYIESAVVAELDPEVRDHDPLLALDGGPDGLAAYRQIATAAFDRLSSGGALLVEIGATQGLTVADLLRQAGFGRLAVEKDLAGLDRMVVGYHL